MKQSSRTLCISKFLQGYVILDISFFLLFITFSFQRLEQETKVFFNLNYLAEVMTLNQFGKAEEYLAAFTDRDENKYSKAMFLEIQKLKCPESTEWLV